MTKFEILQLLAEKCSTFACITDTYQDWVTVGLCCANYGELGRASFHSFSAQSTKYNENECNKVFDNFLKRSKHLDNIGGIVKLLPFNLDNWLQQYFASEKKEITLISHTHNNAVNKVCQNIKQNPSQNNWSHWSSFLPACVRQLAEHGNTDEQKIACFFAACCCFSACMGESAIYYAGNLTYLQIYYGLCGSAGSGKGCINNVKKYFLPLHRKLREINEQERENWRKDKNRDLLQCPANYMFFIPSNISSSALIDALQDNKGAGIMFESELDTLLTAFKADFGNYSALLRANYHNEHISTYRKANKQLNEITNSHLSFCCSGTPDQYAKLLKGEGENGLISRFIFSFIENKSEFNNPFAQTQLTLNSELSQHIIEIHKALSAVPIYCTISEIDANFLVNKMQQIEQLTDNDTQISITRRLALTWVRIACILSILKAFEAHTLTQNHTVDSNIFRSLANVVNWLFDNALKMQAIATSEKQAEAKINRIFAQLSATFSRNDVEILANCTDRTARRYISAWQHTGQIGKPKNGLYTKTDF